MLKQVHETFRQLRPQLSGLTGWINCSFNSWVLHLKWEDISKSKVTSETMTFISWQALEWLFPTLRRRLLPRNGTSQTVLPFRTLGGNLLSSAASHRFREKCYLLLKNERGRKRANSGMNLMNCGWILLKHIHMYRYGRNIKQISAGLSLLLSFHYEVHRHRMFLWSSYRGSSSLSSTLKSGSDVSNSSWLFSLSCRKRARSENCPVVSVCH